MTKPQHRHDPTPERITGAADLLASVPALLGFHPEHSLVLVGLEDTRLVVTARISLQDTTEPTLSDTLRAFTASGVSRIVGALYPDASTRPGHDQPDITAPTAPWPTGVGGRQPHRDVLDRLGVACRSVGVDLLDCLLVIGRRWWSNVHSDDSCCPSLGSPLPSAPTAVQTRAVYDGVSIAPTRQALTARFTPAADRRALVALIAHADAVRDAARGSGRLGSHDRGLTRALFTACRRHPDDPGRVTSDRELARHAVALSNTTVRDTIWLAVDDGRLPDPGLWLELARRLPEPCSAGPLFLYGWHAWRHGNGALAAMAAERALDADPTYRAAELLLGSLAAGVNPGTFPALRPPAEPARPHT